MTKEHIILDQKSIGVSQYFFGLSERKMVSDMRMNWRNVEFQAKHGNKQARWNCRISGK